MESNNKNLVITDPCYLFKGYDGFKDRLDNHGFTSYIKTNTLYGDWSCTTFQTRNNISSLNDIKEYVESVANEQYNNANDEVLGRFCSDGGEVCVVFQDEILKVNPNFGTNECYVGSYFDENGKFIQGELTKESTYNRLATLIPDFTGEIDIHDFEIEGTTHRVVVGFGNINFYTLQTGF